MMDFSSTTERGMGGHSMPLTHDSLFSQERADSTKETTYMSCFQRGKAALTINLLPLATLPPPCSKPLGANHSPLPRLWFSIASNSPRCL